MRIAVILGGVQDPSGIAVNRRSGRLFVNREEYIIHPADRCALELALRLKDRNGADVVVLPRSALDADDVLRQALSRGANRSISPVGAQFDAADEAVAARLQSAIIRQLGEVDLVITGASTLDTGWSQLAARLAQALDWPQVLRAWQAEVRGAALHATRSKDGVYEDVTCVLPAVMSVVAGAMRLRYPDGALLINTYRAKDAIELWPAEELLTEDELSPLLQHKGLHFPPERERGLLIEGTQEHVARIIAEHLRSRANLQGGE